MVLAGLRWGGGGACRFFNPRGIRGFHFFMVGLQTSDVCVCVCVLMKASIQSILWQKALSCLRSLMVHLKRSWEPSGSQKGPLFHLSPEDGPPFNPKFHCRCSPQMTKWDDDKWQFKGKTHDTLPRWAWHPPWLELKGFQAHVHPWLLSPLISSQAFSCLSLIPGRQMNVWFGVGWIWIWVLFLPLWAEFPHS